jgi:hypothetical protein
LSQALKEQSGDVVNEVSGGCGVIKVHAIS